MTCEPMCVFIKKHTRMSQTCAAVGYAAGLLGWTGIRLWMLWETDFLRLFIYFCFLEVHGLFTVFSLCTLISLYLMDFVSSKSLWISSATDSINSYF